MTDPKPPTKPDDAPPAPGALDGDLFLDTDAAALTPPPEPAKPVRDDNTENPNPRG